MNGNLHLIRSAIHPVLLATLLFAGCTDHEPDDLSLQVKRQEQERETASATIKQAVAARLQAADLGFEWSTIEPLLVDARRSFESGEFARANTLAKEAELLAEQAVIQAHHEHQHWQKRVPVIQAP